MIVYADVLFALNWVMDYAALFAAARVLGLAQKRGRLCLGAFIGAAYCVLKLFCAACRTVCGDCGFACHVCRRPCGTEKCLPI